MSFPKASDGGPGGDRDRDLFRSTAVPSSWQSVALAVLGLLVGTVLGGTSARGDIAVGLTPTSTAALSQRQWLSGHVPAAIAQLPSLGRLPGTAQMDLIIALPLRNAGALTHLIQDLTDPTSPRYRRYLTPGQFAEQFGPTEQAYQALIAFSKANNFAVTQTHANRTLLNLRGAVADIERTLHVVLRTYRHPTEGRVFHAPDVEPSLDLSIPVLAVHGLDDYAVPHPADLRPMPQVPTAGATLQAGSAPGGNYWGADFRAAYLPGVALTGAGQLVALLEMDGYFTNDIAAYKTQAGLPDVPITNVLISGYSGAAGGNNSEVALDIEMALAMAPGLSAVVVYESTNTWTGYVSMLNRMATDNLAKQISSSWTWTGGSKTTLDSIFLQYATQGQSFFNASGDSGAYPGTVPTPADDPYITVVGGTTLSTSGPGGAWLSETAWSWFPSTADAGSGGFSTSYALPSWQASVSMAANQGSTTRRNLPDVALTANNIWVLYDNGGAGSFGGTSAAAPLWAGLAALINQKVMAQGQPPVGFINPAVYAMGTGPNYAAAFHDIVTGNNTNASSSGKFFAVAGFDLCTGWGTPNGASLLSLFLQQPAVSTVVPSSGTLAGGNSVTILGSNLGTGDVTSVTLCGIPATILIDNSPTQLIVQAGAAALPGMGAVVVESSSAGEATKTNGYTYVPAVPQMLAAAGVTMNAFQACWAELAETTLFLLDVSTSGDFTICLPGYSNLAVGAVTSYRVSGLTAGSNYYYRVRALQNGVYSDYSNTGQVQTLGASLSIGSGPSAGGNVLTITGVGLGNGGDITSVTICGVAAEIQSQTADSVTVQVMPGGQGGGDIVIQSSSQGLTTIQNGYTYNDPGYIFGSFMGWGGGSNLPTTRAYLATATVNGKLYALGGYNGSYQSAAYVFDPQLPSAGWQSISNLPVARGYLAAAEVAGKLYALGGYNGSYQSAVYVYDPQQPAAGWLSVSNLPVASGYLAAASVRGKLYALGGYNGSYLSAVYAYDPAQPAAGWSSVSNLPATRRSMAAAEVAGKLYVLGGYNGSYQSAAYVYDPQQPAVGWLSVSSLPQASGFLAAASVHGKLYAAGGYNSSGSYLASVYEYDPQQPAAGWLSVSNLPATRRGLTLTGLNETLYALGGYNGTYQATAYQGVFASGVLPTSGSRLGGTTVTITGNNLGHGDITGVTLCGYAAALLADYSPSQIVVRTAASLGPTTGDVVVVSASCGTTVKNGAYGYTEAYATLGVQANPANAGSVLGGGTWVVGSNVLLSASASDAWVFTNWNDGNTNAARVVQVPPTNITYVANFSPTAILQVGVGSGGGGTVSGAGTFIVGATELIAASASNHWVFTGWNDGNTDNPRSLVMSTNGASYTASFSPTVELSLAAQPTNGGSVFGAGTYIVASTQPVAAVASTNWVFTLWDDGDTNAQRQLVIPATNVTVTANFEPTAPIALQVGLNGGGTVAGAGTYIVGSEVQLVAVASNGWLFAGWSDGNSNNPRSVVVTGEGALYAANFAPVVTVTVEALPASGGAVVGGGICWVAADVQLLAVAASNWVFTSWSDADTNAQRTITVPPTNVTYTALFSPTAELTVLADPSPAGGVTGGGVWLVGSSATLTAAASKDWLFTGWNDGDTNAVRSIVVPATDSVYTARFAAAATLLVGANTNAGGGVTGGGIFLVGQSAALMATASNGWRFIQWSDGALDNPRTVVVGAGGASYAAVFAPTAELVVQPASSAGGSVTGTGTYVVGSNAVLTAMASNGWLFIQWSDGDTNAARTVVVPAGGALYTASFSPLGTVSVAASPSDGGGATGAGSYLVGSVATVTATASNNWLFLNWNGSVTNNPWAFSVPPGAMNCTANFARVSTVTGLASPAEGGSVSGGGTYLAGGTVALLATASNNWLFTQWDDGTTNAARSVVVSLTNSSYTAYFAAAARISAGANTNAGGTVTGSGLFLVGGNAVLTATASNGWTFLGGSDGAVANPRLIAVDAGGAGYTAIFAPVAVLNVQPAPADGGGVTGAGTYVVGSNAVLSATAANMWRFIQWSDGVTDNPRNVVVPAGGATYTAKFSPLGTVTVAASPPTGGDVTGDGPYLVGSNATVTATASNGWLFLNWNGSVTNNPWEFAVVASTTSCIATFVRTSTVSVVASPGNAGSVAGGGVYIVGSNVTLTALASNHWMFASWEDNSAVNPRMLTTPLTNSMYTANFAAAATVAVAANTNAGGSVSGGGICFVGSNTVLTATASNGWTFLRWSDGATNNPRAVTVAAAGASFTAVFAPTAVLSVLANPASGGSVLGGGTWLVGSNATLTATASNLWRFIGWSDGVSGNPRTVVVPAGGATYAANFSPLSLVTVLANPAGGGSVTGGGLYLAGTNVTVWAAPSNSWRFINWNGSITNNPWTFRAAAGVTVCTANLARISTLAVLANPANGGSVSGGGTFPVGSKVALSAAPAAGWLLTAWNDGNTNLLRTLAMPATNSTYTATFARGIGAAVDATNLMWTTGGQAPWSVQSLTTRDGVAGLQSGAITAGQQTWFQTTTNGPGSLLFWWKVSAATNSSVQFYIDTQLVSQISGDLDWSQYVGFIGTSNAVTLKWVYTKGSGTAAGSDAGWVDQVSWLPCPYATHVPQLFYQDPAGTLASWVLGTNGGMRFARLLANTGGWALKAVGDIDGDGVGDLLFQTASGETSAWFMNADGSIRSARSLWSMGGWVVKALGDYEGTGRAQVFFQDAGGHVAYWRLDTNGNNLGSVSLGAMGGWILRGIGDLDGDHQAELFWQDAHGTVAIWYHKPDGTIRGIVPYSTGGWRLCGVTDIDGDGISDLLWQDGVGNTGGWFMNSNGTARSASYWWNTGGWKLKGAGR